MKIQYLFLRCLTIFMIVAVLTGPRVYADDTRQFNRQIKSLHTDRHKMELRLHIDQAKDTYPRATSYYDDLVDHYEQTLIMSDFIDKGIR
jgi:hypothetical protein